MTDPNHYGATNGDPSGSNGNKDVLHRFAIAEPYTPLGYDHSEANPLRVGGARRRSGLAGGCPGGHDDDTHRTIKIVVVSMFVFAAAVTAALIIQIASGSLHIPYVFH